jgi:hypothetical protein
VLDSFGLELTDLIGDMADVLQLPEQEDARRSAAVVFMDKLLR